MRNKSLPKYIVAANQRFCEMTRRYVQPGGVARRRASCSIRPSRSDRGGDNFREFLAGPGTGPSLGTRGRGRASSVGGTRGSRVLGQRPQSGRGGDIHPRSKRPGGVRGRTREEGGGSDIALELPAVLLHFYWVANRGSSAALPGTTARLGSSFGGSACELLPFSSIATVRRERSVASDQEGGRVPLHHCVFLLGRLDRCRGDMLVHARVNG